MWTPLITVVALVLLALITAAGAVTSTAADRDRGQRALTVLKMLLGGTLGTSGVFAMIARLH
jgi:preprotein translocase subunit SecY